MHKDIRIKNHMHRLQKFYLTRGVSTPVVDQIIAAKLNRLDPKLGPEDYTAWLMKLFSFITEEFGPVNQCLDLGCGTGEFVVLLNKLGIKSDGSDIYTEEIQIATQLISDYELTAVSILNSDVVEYEKYDLITLFSVLEHMNDAILRQILNKLKSANVKNIFILVPNKYKVIDDHTGLPFLGVLPRFIARALLKCMGIRYELSEKFDWDVWYRSPKKIEAISKECGYTMQKIPDKLVYPPLQAVQKISEIKPKSSISTWVMRIYTRIILKLVPAHSLNDYPYLNFILSLDEKNAR